ncbi:MULTISPECIES: type II toxin-antitoxin system PrlF family antitoxin [Methylocaldum]|uniref:type II toxin-antitoxin system PrlF family antitoxin n=1 Tax=unclassified Methylocaldum TaxID=2622260 RepID=UPI001F0A5691|nr:type II toxin-antitoxin system PrlF family antitoxin [Methylocaldum sp. 14B]
MAQVRSGRAQHQLRVERTAGGRSHMSKSLNDDKTTSSDPAETAFLNLLGQDIAARRERLQTVDTDLVRRVRSLVRELD